MLVFLIFKYFLCILQLKESNEGITLKRIWIEGNLSGDKKNTNFSAVLGRGISVSVKANIPEEVLNKVLNTTSESFYEFAKYAARMGERSNMCGLNANVSNVLAAAFAACGQDIACVNEASVAKTDVTLNNGPEKGIHLTLYMPNLIVGTVGGGTNLPTQKECLDIIGCHGIGKSRKLAEIIASFCLALDLSTLCAIDAGDFANAHEALGRNKT
jgi:hydroxymethylglutaryl-CoA reductase